MGCEAQGGAKGGSCVGSAACPLTQTPRLSAAAAAAATVAAAAATVAAATVPMELPLSTPHDAWDPLTQSWLVDLALVAPARAQPAASFLSKAKLLPPSKPSPQAPSPLATPQALAPKTVSPAAASRSDEVPMTPEAMEASSIALAWRLQQEEQAAFYHAINENTPGPTARSVAATPAEAPLMASLGEAGSPEDASLQLALRLQQARASAPPGPSPLPQPPDRPATRAARTLWSVTCAGGAALAADAVAPDLHGGNGRRRSRRRHGGVRRV